MCPSAQAMQRCEHVPTNSLVISGARASTAAYRTNMKVCGQLPVSLRKDRDTGLQSQSSLQINQGIQS